MDLSIIIPVYNSEMYIEQCLMSVRNQTCSSLEIICIDDGSTDASAEIIRKMQEEDSRIRLFQQSNQGAGTARNLGIKEARGKYLAFLDSDDFYGDADALEKMVDQCERLKVEAGGSFRIKLDDGNKRKDMLFQEFAIQPFEPKVYKYSDFQMDYDYQSFIFSTDVVREHEIVFPEYRRYQDPPFMVRALYYAQEFTIVDTYLYCYRVPNVAARFNNSKMKDLLMGLQDNLVFASEKKLDKLFRKSLERLEYEYCSIIFHNISDDDAEAIELLIEIGKIVKEYLNINSYIVRPLRQMLSTIVDKASSSEEELLSWMKQQDILALYGAGRMTRVFLAYLVAHNLKDRVQWIVVSDTKNNPESVEDIPVISVENYKEKQSALLVTVSGLYQKEVEDVIIENGIRDYKLIDDVLLCQLQAQMIEEE